MSEFSKFGLKRVKYLAKGHRSVVYTGFFKNKKVAIKVEGKIEGKIKNEAYWLRKLNKYRIGPKLLFFERNFIVYEFVNGERFVDWIKEAKKEEIIKVLKELFRQVRVLDRLKVDKEELTRPVKHILISKKVIMIDFERCRVSKRPHNVTQFCQFLISKNIYLILKEDGFKFKNKELIEILKRYKNDQTEKNFKEILISVFSEHIVF